MANVLYLLSDTCRLCLDVPGTYDLKQNTNLIHDIFSCTGILQVSNTDKLPKTICANCMYKIQISKDIREYATKNDKYMRCLLLKNDDNEPKRQITKPKVQVRSLEEDKRPGFLKLKNRTTQTETCDQNDTDNSKTQNNLAKKYKTRSTQTEKSMQKDKENADSKKNKISVRSLADINTETCFSVGTTTVKHQSHHEKDRRSSARDRKSSVNDHTSPVKDPPSSPKWMEVSEKKLQNEDLFKCEICKKIYPTWKKLYLHKRSHAKSLCCPLDACSKRFATKGDLQKHIRSHTGEKPYRCNLCDKSFTQNVSLRAHKVAIHEAKMEIMT